MNADKDTIKSKIEVIRDNKDYLENKESFEPEDESFEELQALKHSLLEIIEACIDISSHIIAAEGFEKPNSYAENFDKLSDNNLIDDNLGKRLGDMAGFRNFLVHRYDDLNPERIEEFIDSDLEDVSEFLEDIYDYMKIEATK